MKGSPDIIDTLNHLLAGELTAIDQYFLHGRLCREWGFNRLHEQIEHEMQEERQHADALIARILFLEGIPDLSRRHPLNIGTDLLEILGNDLELEYRVVAELRKAIALCESSGDYQTRNMLMPLLKDTEEDHAHWLEKQLGLIEKTGLANYQQSQL